MLTDAARVLRWAEPQDGVGHRVEVEFEALLSELLHELWRSTGPLGGPFVDSSLPTEAYRRALLAPRTVRRLLWYRARQHNDVCEYWLAACRAEKAVLGLPVPGRQDGWTADGRAYVRADGRVMAQPLLSGEIAVDQCSPHALRLDLSGGNAPAEPLRQPPSAATSERVVARLQDAWRGIGASSPEVQRNVRTWARVIVAQSDASGRFWSGSNGQYIGRVMIVNADAPSTPTEELADALVHEAIHAFLYMHEFLQPWVLGNALYTSAGVIRSPWSGNQLPVRPYMQAAFVWYGLAMFWAQHLGGKAFDTAQACSLLERALSGFRRGPLVDRLKPWKAKIKPEVIEAVDGLQQDILSLLPA